MAKANKIVGVSVGAALAAVVGITSHGIYEGNDFLGINADAKNFTVAQGKCHQALAVPGGLTISWASKDCQNEVEGLLSLRAKQAQNKSGMCFQDRAGNVNDPLGCMPAGYFKGIEQKFQKHGL